MSKPVKRLRQTTLFELVNSKRGKIFSLMEADVIKSEMRDILAAAAEKRRDCENTNLEKSTVAPDSIDIQSSSTTGTVEDSSSENVSLIAQNSDDLFPEYSAGSSLGNSGGDINTASSKTQVHEVQLKRLPECCPSLPPLKSSDTHTVMFKLPLQDGMCPEPYPHNYHDVWDSCHVKMPCSPENKCAILEDGEKSIGSRWELIEKSLLQDITSSYDLQEAILQYNSQYANLWDFRGLHAFFKDCLQPEDSDKFFKHTLPAMVRLTLQLPQICTQPIPLLRRQTNHAITLSQKQIACLLSNAFFCTFPRRNISRKRNEQRLQNEYAYYPDINFNRLYSGIAKGILPRKAEKLKCLLNYFARVTSEEPIGTMTFHRQNLQQFPEWSLSEKTIQTVVVDSDGVIEVGGTGMLQVDFANKYVGGGVLGNGSVQEEIRFVICPELIISRLFTECLGISDVLLVSGAEQFNKHSGYADSFTWDGDFQDQTPRDVWGRRTTNIVAMDALRYCNPVDQYRTAIMQREVNKAFCGFYESDIPVEKLPAVATGNWGCGVYKGNPHLKFLIQLMAASQVGREMLYFTFKSCELEKEIKHMYSLILSNNIRVGDIWSLLSDYSSIVSGPLKTNPPAFYKFFCGVFSAGNVDDSSRESTSSSVQTGTTASAEEFKPNENNDFTDDSTDIEPSSQNELG